MLGKSQSASFTFQSTNGNFCNPDSVIFTPTTSQTPIGYTWTFGNGQPSSNSTSPKVRFNAGTFTVKLVVVFSNTVVETTQMITINPSPSVILNFNKNKICKPDSIAFTANTTNIINAYVWIFGDGISTTTTTAATTHFYASYGTYYASVKVINQFGCATVSDTQVIIVAPPTIIGDVNPKIGCAPILTNFTQNVTLPTGETVSSFTWNFGDGSPTSSLGTHTYTSAGVYASTLNIITNSGCTQTFTYDPVNVGISPVLTSALPLKLIYCGWETAFFTAVSPTATHFKWEYGDGSIDSISSATTAHKYPTIGVKTVKVTPYTNGCAGTPITFTIEIIGVIARYNFTNTCANKKKFNFVNLSEGTATSVLWNFDDGSPNENISNPIHTYPAMGNFNTVLIVTDNISGCADTTYRIMRTANPSLINADTFVCRNSLTKFEVQNDYILGSSSYTWDILNISAFITNSATANALASMYGNFPFNRVILFNGPGYCSDTLLLNHPIAVRGPSANFLAPEVVCSITKFNVINNSTTYIPTDTITVWQWDFGNGLSTQSTYQPTPIQTPVQTSDFTNFPIKLIAKDKNGCTDTATKIIRAKLTSFLRIFPRSKIICAGQKDTLIAYHSESIFQWLPYPGLLCASCDTFIVAPVTTGFIYATALNTLGCTARDSSIAIVASPFSASAVSNPQAVCVGGSLTLNASPPNKKISWSPTTNISNTAIYNPIVNPIATTKYSAILEDSLGCFKDTAYVDAIIKTLPIVNLGSDKIYPYGTIFTLSPIYSSNIVSYNWLPTTGTLTCTTCPVPDGIADKLRIYTVTVKSDSGCVASDNIKISITCENANILLPVAFTPNGDNVNEKFKPTTRGIKTINSFLVFNRFGQKIYEAKNFIPNSSAIGWDGKFNGELQDTQAYVFYLNCTCDSGEVLEKKGTVILLK